MISDQQEIFLWKRYLQPKGDSSVETYLQSKGDFSVNKPSHASATEHYKKNSSCQKIDRIDISEKD